MSRSEPASASPDPTSARLIRAAQRLRDRIDKVPLCGAAILRKGFGTLDHVYNPLDYAWEPHREYIERYGRGGPRRIVLVGMNPGPWGMGQTGVPFGDPAMVREWLGIQGAVGAPANCHPGRPVLGFDSKRREESGTTLWGWARQRFGTPERFFELFYVTNYCPLLMFDTAGKNVTPADFRKGAPQLAALEEACDEHLAEVLQALGPAYVVGVGRFARDRAQAVVEAANLGCQVGCITHPSPQTRGRWGGGAWSDLIERELYDMKALDPVTTP